jgi:hypothetical protein
MSTTVYVGRTAPQYNTRPPYHPDQRFPESRSPDIATEPNAPYSLLRNLLHARGFDVEHFGTSEWNPLGDIVLPGMTVLLKPNFVVSRHVKGGDLYSIVTHPSILRALVDYVFIALQGRGRIVIADSPQMDCNWDELMAAMRLDTICDFYEKLHGFRIEVLDLRNFTLVDAAKPAYSGNRKPLAGESAAPSTGYPVTTTTAPTMTARPPSATTRERRTSMPFPRRSSAPTF